MQFKSLTLGIVAAFASMGFVAAPASAILIIPTNASFQDPDVDDGVFTDTTITPVPDWTFATVGTGNFQAGVWDPQDSDYTGTDGDNAQLPGTALTGQTAFIYLEQTDDLSPQALGASFTTNAAVDQILDNMTYTLTVALGDSKQFNAGNVKLEMLVNGVPVVSQMIAAGSLVNDSFVDRTATFSTGENDPLTGGALTVRITHEWNQAGFKEVEIDNVRVDVEEVPEPSSALAFVALGALLGKRRR